MKFTRPQVYMRRKEDIKRLEDDFTKSGNNNLSEYFRELIMLGLDFKNKEDNVSLIKSMMYEIFIRLDRNGK